MDIVVRVIDHLGDVGVGVRLAVAIHRYQPGLELRILTDDPAPFVWMMEEEEKTAIPVLDFSKLDPATINFSDIIIELLGCRIPEPFKDLAYNTPRLIIHLEALSAEPWVSRVHGSESLLGTPARRFILCPGFTPDTLGLLPPMPLAISREEWNRRTGNRFDTSKLWICVYTYSDISPILSRLDHETTEIISIPADLTHPITQREFDTLLSLSDFNIVRGEDSFATALQSCKPFLWQAYQQDNRYHLQKTEAFLKWYMSSHPFTPEWAELMRRINDPGDLVPESLTLAFFRSFGTIPPNVSVGNAAEKLLKVLDQLKER